MMKALAVLATHAALLVAGCSSSSDQPKKAPFPAPASFATDEPAIGNHIVYLRGRSESPGAERVVLDVVAQGAGPSVHGAAFRLSWDTAKLAFVEAHVGAVWSKQAVALAKEGLPGELVVVWSEKGNSPGVDASGETVLGSIDFRLKTGEASTLAFRPDRSTLRDRDGAPVTVEWRGGRIAPR